MNVEIIKKIIRTILIINVFIFAVTLFYKNSLPKSSQISNKLLQWPSQTETSREPFTIEKEGIEYTVTPKYEYELYGLIVSDYNSENIFDIMHKNDPLNTKDLCVIWGENLENNNFKKVKYTHGEFTCFYRYSDSQMNFKHTQLSNNHLLPDNDEIYKKIKNTAVSDQIHLKGYLANYSISNTEQGDLGKRTTSISREDTGNGACEVIYVNDFEILKKGNIIFSMMNTVSKYVIVICTVILVLFWFRL